MKHQFTLILVVAFLSLLSCQKSEQTTSVEPNDHQQKIEQLQSDLNKANAELDKLRAKNAELTTRLIDKEAGSSTLTKVMKLGLRKYTAGNNRAACILNIRNFQQAVRAHQNLNGFEIGQKIVWSDIIGPQAYLEEMPQCPLGGEYKLGADFPKVGQAIAHCPHEKEHKHAPDSTEGW